MPEWSCASAFLFVIGLTWFVERPLVRVLVLGVNRKSEWSLVVWWSDHEPQLYSRLPLAWVVLGQMLWFRSHHGCPLSPLWL